jgi:phosphatidylserine/phosphatidylglycerophosphate/cardiolipin synthase-like enzyme
MELRPGPWRFGALGAWEFINCVDGAQLGEHILARIMNARRTLMAVSPMVEDPRVVEALLAARRRGVRVRVLTQLRENSSKGIRYPTRGFEGLREEWPLDEHFAALRQLVAGRVFCRGLRHHTHAKLLLADDVCVISSANLSANSLGWGGRPSIEAGIELEGADAAVWAETCAALWDAAPFRMHLCGAEVSLQEVGTRAIEESSLARETAAGRMAWTFPSAHRGLRDLLAETIDIARRRVILSALSFYHTDRVPRLHTALEAALHRGVAVSVVVRTEHFTAAEYPDLSTAGLLRSGLRLLGVTGLHAKGILVDDRWCGVGSANFNPFSLDSDLESANVECGIIGDAAAAALAPFAAFLTGLAEGATHELRL